MSVQNVLVPNDLAVWAGSIQFNASGNQLEDYREIVLSATCVGALSQTLPNMFKLVKVGNLITLCFNQGAVETATANGTIVTNNVIPAEYRPTNNVHSSVVGSLNSAYTVFGVQVSSSGGLTVSNGLGSTFAITNQIQFLPSSISWLV